MRHIRSKHTTMNSLLHFSWMNAFREVRHVPWVLFVVGVLLFYVRVEAHAETSPTSLTVDAQVEIPTVYSPDATLLIRQFKVDQLGFKIFGKIILHSLAPLRGQLQLAEGQGDLRHILTFLSGWVSLPVDLPDNSQSQKIRFRNLIVGFGSEGPLHVTMDLLALPEGTIKNATFRMEPDQKQWTLTTRALKFSHLPLWLNKDVRVSDIDGKNLKVTKDATGLIKMHVDRVAAEGSYMEQIVVQWQEPTTKQTGSWKLFSKKGSVDVGRTLKRLWQFQPISDWLTKQLTAVGLAKLSASGRLKINSLDFSGSMGEQVRVMGSAQVHSQNVAFHLPPPRKNASIVTLSMQDTILNIDSAQDGTIQVKAFLFKIASGGKPLANLQGDLVVKEGGHVSLSMNHANVFLDRLLAVVTVVPLWREALDSNLRMAEIKNFWLFGRLEAQKLTAILDDGLRRLTTNLVWHDGSVKFSMPLAKNATSPRHAKPRRMKVVESSVNIDFQDDTTTFKKIKFLVHESTGGTLRLQGQGEWPIVLERLRLDVESKAFSWQKRRLDGRFGWNGSAEMPLELAMVHPDGAQVKVEGKVALWNHLNRLGMDIILRNITAQLPETEKAQKTDRKLASQEGEKPDLELFPDGAPQLPFPIRIQADQIMINRWPSLQKFQVLLLPGESKQKKKRHSFQISWYGDWCLTSLNGEMRIEPEGELKIQSTVRIRDVNLSNLIGCGLMVSNTSEEPPIYLEGSVYGHVSAFMHGKNAKNLQKNMKVDASFSINNGKIARLSKLNKVFGFIVDILQITGNSPTKLRDTLVFEQLVLRTEATSKKVKFRTVKFASKILKVGGQAEMDLRPEHPILELNLKLKAPFSPEIDFQKTISFKD